MFKRNKDLVEVFDERWKANHNDDVKIARAHEKEFIDRMFDVKVENGKINTVGNMQRDFNTLNKNINNQNEINRINRLNNLKGKF